MQKLTYIYRSFYRE